MQTTDITNILQTKTYAATILGQISRISDGHEVIQNKAISMGLSVQAKEGDVKPTANTALTDTHKILDTASAINSINVQTFLLQNASGYVATATPSTTESSTYTIPVGYNKTPITLTFTRPTLNGNADTSQVLSGKTFYTTDYNQKVGTMANKSGNQTTSSVGSYSKSNVNYLYLGIPGTGYYTDGSQLQSSILYQPLSGTQTVEITKTTFPETNESTVTVNTLTIPAGYYANPVTVQPILSTTDGGNKIINTTTYTATGAVTNAAPGTGFDYFTAVTVAAAVGTAKPNGTYEVTTPGWITKATYGTPYGGYADDVKHSIAGYTDAKFGLTTAPTLTSTITTQYFTDSLTKGHTDAVTCYRKVQDGVATSSTALDKTVVQLLPVISEVNKDANGSNVTTGSKTTTAPTSGFYIQVKTDALSEVVTATGTTKIDQGGWFNTTEFTSKNTVKVQALAAATTYIPIAAGTHTINNIQQTTAEIKDGTTTLVAANHYYIKCDTTEGYQRASTKYIDIANGAVSSVNITYNSTSKAFTGSVTTSAGYYPKAITTSLSKTVNQGTNPTVSRSSSKTIAANTYYPSNATINVTGVAGTLTDTGTTNTNISSASNATTASTTNLGNLTADTTFYGINDAYMTSFKVEVSDLIKALQAI